MDAAIAGLICTSVMNPQSSGLGGGVIFTIYNASTGMGQPCPLHGALSPCRHPAAVEKSESFMFSRGNFMNIMVHALITNRAFALNPKDPLQGVILFTARTCWGKELWI